MTPLVFTEKHKEPFLWNTLLHLFSTSRDRWWIWWALFTISCSVFLKIIPWEKLLKQLTFRLLLICEDMPFIKYPLCFLPTSSPCDSFPQTWKLVAVQYAWGKCHVTELGGLVDFHKLHTCVTSTHAKKQNMSKPWKPPLYSLQLTHAYLTVKRELENEMYAANHTSFRLLVARKPRTIFWGDCW